MQKLQFTYQESCRLEDKHFQMLEDRMSEAVANARTAYAKQYETPYGFAYAPEDESYYQNVVTLAETKRSQNPAAVFVVGIGGSSLGTVAIENAVRGLFSRECMQDVAFYCADTIDTDRTYQLCTIMRRFLEQEQDVILNVVSKSGTTTETLINASIFIDLLKQYRPDSYHKWLVVTTDPGSPLETYANERNIECLHIPQEVAGRYSVLTAVGIFPLHVMGVDTKALLQGARRATNTCLQAVYDNPAVLSAMILYQHYAHGRNIHDTFLFDAGLRELGEWYRQLMGESIGKRKGDDNQLIRVGITPTVSIGTLDLHSVAQLYLAGPYDKFTTFVHIKHHPDDVTIPDVGLTQKLPITGKRVETVKEAILSGVQRAYYNERRAFVTISLADKSEESLGEFIQFKMFEMVYLANILGVNPFNQPQVELYKQETRAVLQGVKES